MPLAAALSLPIATSAAPGTADPADRPLVLVLTVSVVAVTLVTQGLTLAPVVRASGLAVDLDSDANSIANSQVRPSMAAERRSVPDATSVRREARSDTTGGSVAGGVAMSVAEMHETKSPETELDQAKQEEFAGRMVQVLNDSCLGLMAGLGHESGLFDVMADLAPSTSEQIAQAAGLNERYVREWLGAMVTGGVVDYRPDQATYALPAEHAASLTRAAGPDNLARIAQDLSMLAEVEQQVLEAFRTGQGVPYAAYPRFQAIQAEESSEVYDLALVGGIVPLIPGLTEKLREGIDVLDVGTGQGHAVNVLAKEFPASRFHGLDKSEEGIAAGRAEAEAWNLDNADFRIGDGANPADVAGPYDLITAFDVIHDLARPAATLETVSRALRDDGVFLMGDIAASSRLEENLEHPLCPALYAFSVFYCMSVSLGEGGEGLGTVWGEQTARRMLAEAGFADVDVQRVEGDILNVYYAAHR